MQSRLMLFGTDEQIRSIWERINDEDVDYSINLTTFHAYKFGKHCGGGASLGKKRILYDEAYNDLGNYIAQMCVDNDIIEGSQDKVMKKINEITKKHTVEL